MAYAYTVSAQRPTIVNHAVAGDFTGHGRDLLVAKCTRIEVFRLSPEGLVPELEFGVYGRVAVMQLFRPPREPRDLLFVLTERYAFVVLAYDPATGEVLTRANGDARDQIGHPIEQGHMGIIDPTSRMIGLHLYQARSSDR